MRWLTTLLAVAVLTLAGCGEQSATSSGGDEPIGTGKVADLDFTGTTLDGESFDGIQLEGTPAVLWFWAPWCPTCRAQSGAVSELAEEYDGRVAVIGVGSLDDEGAIRDFAEHVPQVTHLVDADGEVWQHFRVTAQSTYTVVGADGEIMAEGYLDDDELAALVAELVD